MFCTDGALDPWPHQEECDRILSTLHAFSRNGIDSFLSNFYFMYKAWRYRYIPSRVFLSQDSYVWTQGSLLEAMYSVFSSRPQGVVFSQAAIATPVRTSGKESFLQVYACRW